MVIGGLSLALEILHFKYPRVSAVNDIATRTFRDKKQQQQSRFFLPITLTWITETELWNKILKTKETNFVGRIT